MDACSSIVERFGKIWGQLGWLLFCGTLLLPFVLSYPLNWISLFACGALTLIWLFIDAVDQQVPTWQILLGAAMIAIGCLPSGRLLIIACWIVYWTKVRE